MDGINVKKDDENGQLSCRIYSSPAAARLSLRRLGRRSLDKSYRLQEKQKAVVNNIQRLMDTHIGHDHDRVCIENTEY